MSPALPREERDAIRARNDRVGLLDGRHDRLWIEAAEASLDDVPTLLDALDAAEEEVAALRERMQSLANDFRDLALGEAHVVTRMAVATSIEAALAADEGERTGR